MLENVELGDAHVITAKEIAIDCAGSLICEQRSGYAQVLGCKGAGGTTDVYSKDVCVKPIMPIVFDKNCSNCGICTGDCDRDSDCQGTMRCAQRSGTETVPGCSFGSNLSKRKDFCFEVQIVEDNVINYVGECDPSTYLCDVCEGDCDNDDDCSGDLICRQRSGFEEVPGCIGEGGSTYVFKKDICMKPEIANPTSSPTIAITSAPTSSLTVANTPAPTSSPTVAITPAPTSSPTVAVTPSPSYAYPVLQIVPELDCTNCALCTGDCDNDGHCQGDLRCAQRSNANGLENVPGCSILDGDRLAGEDFCFQVQSVQAGVINYVGECDPNRYYCNEYEGDCDVDDDCAGALICKQRSGFEAVPGCSGEVGSTDLYAKDICVKPTLTDIVLNGDCTNCALCTGDCDSDSDCQGDMRCAQRSNANGLENVPGCSFSSDLYSGKDFCFQVHNVPTGLINYVGECDPTTFLYLGCQGDCDGDEDCAGDLICEQRSELEAVTGCSGEGGLTDVYAKDICVNPGGPPPNEFYEDSLRIREAECTSSNPCSMCYGSCLVDSDCEGSLKCFIRSGSEPIPNCVTGSSQDIANTNYCYDAPTNGDVTYIPGELVERFVDGIRLELSVGLTARLIARSYTPLFGTNFHGDPDAAVVFPKSNGGWIYVSNSEKTNGGVGAIHFDSNGEMTDYEMILDNTSQNCGGGKTYWGTWVTCEETSGGQVYEVDPYTGTSAQTVIGNSGGAYESFAYDARNKLAPTFYVTHDRSNGAMVRYTPDSAIVAAAESTGDYSKVLNDQGTSGVHHWLVLNPTSGTFTWTTDRSFADNNASQHYPSAEGIDIRDGILYFTTKGQKRLFILDLDAETYTWQSTNQGAFSGQPDQIQRILANDSDNDMLYFCEEAASDNGIHARDVNGDFYRIIDGGELSSETTGLAFSPDNTHMYVSYQSDGYIFDITREDGYAFGAHRLDIKYHAV